MTKNRFRNEFRNNNEAAYRLMDIYGKKLPPYKEFVKDPESDSILQWFRKKGRSWSYVKDLFYDELKEIETRKSIKSKLDSDDKYYYVNHENLSLAIQNAIREKDDKEIPYEQAYQMSEFLLDFFGYNHFVIDNKFKSKDRDILYDLQDYGILTTHKEETTTLKGKIWRIHYWLLRTDNIKRLSEQIPEKEKKKTKDEKIQELYDEISEDIWDRNT